MADNGISTLPTKEARQKAKLELAAANRIVDGNSRAAYDIEQLPTQYDNNTVVANSNTLGLQLGRPWIDTPSVSYTVVPRQFAVDEGVLNGTTFDIYTTGVPDGVIYYTVTGTVTGADFVDGVLPSGIVFINNGVGVVSFPLATDGLTEGTENYALELRTGSISGPIVATSALVTVNDTST